MLKKGYIIIIITIVLAIIAIIIVFGHPDLQNINTQKPSLERLVAHAGGEIYGITYSNSLEALNSSYTKNFKLFELDFEWTKDGYPVCLHDWDKMGKRMFLETPKQLTLKEFHDKQTFLDLTLIDLSQLEKWLLSHPGAYIITDVKNKNIALLDYICQNHNNIKHRIIPQVYSTDEYVSANKLGYSSIIFSLYYNNIDNLTLVKFCKTHNLFAITMSEQRANSELPNLLKSIGVPTYVHTINSVSIYEGLLEKGVYGIYTDCFEPDHWIN